MVMNLRKVNRNFSKLFRYIKIGLVFQVGQKELFKHKIGSIRQDLKTEDHILILVKNIFTNIKSTLSACNFKTK